MVEYFSVVCVLCNRKKYIIFHFVVVVLNKFAHSKCEGTSTGCFFFFIVIFIYFMMGKINQNTRQRERDWLYGMGNNKNTSIFGNTTIIVKKNYRRKIYKITYLMWEVECVYTHLMVKTYKRCACLMLNLLLSGVFLSKKEH